MQVHSYVQYMVVSIDLNSKSTSIIPNLDSRNSNYMATAQRKQQNSKTTTVAGVCN